jgi:hypothetical protein
MIKPRFLVIFSLFLAGLGAQPQLSERAQISLITGGPYQGELYSAFGHSAVRVYDPAQGINWVYNYGIFDFDQPNFYLNFAKGNLLYKCAKGYYPAFESAYRAENRYLKEQILALSPRQKQDYFNFLEWNARPENATYRYDYFYDNCATRIRDGLQKSLGRQLIFDSTYVQASKSIRELCDDYLRYQAWGDFGIDLALGLPMDKKASAWEYMFLPDYLAQGLAAAQLEINGKVQPLVDTKRNIAEAGSQPLPNQWASPSLVFFLLFGLSVVVTMYSWRQPEKARFWDALLFFTVGLIGLFLLLLWLATDHAAAARNLNLLWAWPLHLIAAFGLLQKGTSKPLKNYLWLWTIYAALLVSSWLWLPQDLSLALIPLTASLALRGWHRAWHGQPKKLLQ